MGFFDIFRKKKTMNLKEVIKEMKKEGYSDKEIKERLRPKPAVGRINTFHLHQKINKALELFFDKYVGSSIIWMWNKIVVPLYRFRIIEILTYIYIFDVFSFDKFNNPNTFLVPVMKMLGIGLSIVVFTGSYWFLSDVTHKEMEKERDPEMKKLVGEIPFKGIKIFLYNNLIGGISMLVGGLLTFCCFILLLWWILFGN
jgi:hypothetical protein